MLSLQIEPSTVAAFRATVTASKPASVPLFAKLRACQVLRITAQWEQPLFIPPLPH